MTSLLIFLFLAAAPPWNTELQKARDMQDRAQLERITGQQASAADQQAGDAQAQYRAALTNSALAEVATESHDRVRARSASEAGIKYAERSAALKTDIPEYHR